MIVLSWLVGSRRNLLWSSSFGPTATTNNGEDEWNTIHNRCNQSSMNAQNVQQVGVGRIPHTTIINQATT